MLNSSPSPILPPATLGILGGGQLGRMLILAGRPLGYRFLVYEPKPGSCAGVLADRETNAHYSDQAALESFARDCDLVTLEFENVPLSALQVLEDHTLLAPGIKALEICQHRLREKELFAACGVPCAPWAAVNSAESLRSALKKIGTPSVLKTATLGYDGKGQIKIDRATAQDPSRIWTALGAPEEAILEGWVNFEDEYSAICARSSNGSTRVFPMARNHHRNHILHQSRVPSGLPSPIEAEGARIAERLAEELDLVGLLAVEFFLNRKGKLIANEMAPRPHNSGHWSIDGCATSQFEQHLRAICGLPLGPVTQRCPVTMTNLLGDLWKSGTPDWSTALREPGLKLHLYDKGEAKPGRKMGHVNRLDEA